MAVDAAEQLHTAEPTQSERNREIYGIDSWGRPYYTVNDRGNVAIRPLAESDLQIDLHDVVDEIRRRGVELPVLVRFQDILRRRVVELNEQFRSAIDEFEYKGVYRGVYPIKVNQLHEVVLEILDAGEPYSFGLECGSKAEFLAALPHLDRDERLLICNGYKDSTMIGMIVEAQRLGKNVLPIVEKYHEFDEILSAARQAAFDAPFFGVRVRLSTAGSGKWAESGGDRSKFGVSIPQIIEIVDRLRAEDRLDAFRLVHFHIGSQIGEINTLKGAVREATRVYAKLRKLGVPIEYIDVGGGLGVIYDGIDSGYDQSINYTLEEYVNGVVYTIREICEIEGVDHPTIVSESGRSLTAHHSVLIVGVLSTSEQKNRTIAPEIDEADEPVLRELGGLYSAIGSLFDDDGLSERRRIGRALETYHDALEKRREADQLFSLGYLTLDEKGKAERLYWRILSDLADRLSAIDRNDLPVDLAELGNLLVDQYLCDFSIFQSMLDYWAIGQLFPIMPIHRLDEEPTRRGILVDLTCDSDGKIDRFIGPEGEDSSLPLHEPGSEPYYLGCFLMGAYQDILGDMHNLFGRVNEVHIYGDEEEEKNFYVETTITGTRIREALRQVQYSRGDLRKRMEEIIRKKVRSGAIRPRPGADLLDRYLAALDEYTYYNFRPLPSETATETKADAAARNGAETTEER